MLTEKQLEAIPTELVSIFQELEMDIINDIARRLKKTATFTATAEAEIASLAKLGYSEARIKKEILKILAKDKDFQAYVAKSNFEYKKYVTGKISLTYKEALKANKEALLTAGELAFNNDKEIWNKANQTLEKSPELNRTVSQYTKRANSKLKDLSKSLGFKNVSGYTNIRNAYMAEVDKAITKLSTGIYSMDNIVKNSVIELANNGIKKIYYESGSVREVDSTIRSILRTTSSQIAGDITMGNIEQTGVEHVEVSSHSGSRPSHASWQGEVYTLKEFKKVCRYGEPKNPDAIYSYNCRHTHYPYWKGISEPLPKAKEPPDVEYNGKTYNAYQASQEMRRQERNIRAKKREINALNELKEDTSQQKAKLKELNAEYTNLCNTIGTYRRSNLTSVVKT